LKPALKGGVMNQQISLPKPLTAPPLFLATLGLPMEPVENPANPYDVLSIYQDYPWGDFQIEAIQGAKIVIRIWENKKLGDGTESSGLQK